MKRIVKKCKSIVKERTLERVKKIIDQNYQCFKD